MVAFTKDGQLKPEMAQKRAQDEGIDLDTKKEERSDFPDYKPHRKADHWQSGKTVQLKTHTVDVKMK
jgi:hypothetical protein